MLLTTFTYKLWTSSHGYAELVGRADGCDYDGQQNYTTCVCDVCRPYHSILSILKANFSLNWTNLLCLQLALVLRSPNLVVFVSTTMITKLMTEPIALPLRSCACVQLRVIMLWSCIISIEIYYNLASFK